jgi:mannose-6-phosphate isomerase-like protein (cupin superfamily)
MNRLLLPSLMLTGTLAFAQAPATQKPAAPATQTPPAAAPSTQKPPAAAPQTQKPATAPRRAAQPASRAGMAITVTDMRGMTISGVHVEVTGPTARMGETDRGGLVNFPCLTAGTYRLRFTGDPVTAFEKEVSVRAGQIADVNVALSAAPPTPEAPPPPGPEPASAPPPAPLALGPSGQPQTLFVPDILEKEFVGRQARRETLLSCSGNTRTTMIQLNEPQAERLYAEADAVYYAIGGEGTVVINSRTIPLNTNGFVSVPRDTTHSFMRRGNRPLILLAVLSGEPCEQAR